VFLTQAQGRAQGGGCKGCVWPWFGTGFGVRNTVNKTHATDTRNRGQQGLVVDIGKEGWANHLLYWSAEPNGGKDPTGRNLRNAARLNGHDAACCLGPAGFLN